MSEVAFDLDRERQLELLPAILARPIYSLVIVRSCRGRNGSYPQVSVN